MSFKDAFTKEGAGGNPLNYDDSAFAYFASTCLTCVLIPWSATYLENRLHIFSRSWAGVMALRQKLGCRQPAAPLVANKVCDAKAENAQGSVASCECSLCHKKRLTLLREKPLFQRFFGEPSDWLQLGGILALTLALLYIGKFHLSMMPNVGTFNPWTILNITEGETSDRIVKKAFRTMSLKYHPDRNPNDATTAAKFILISKAYHTLTDEVAMRNFEKYGNPDGRTGMMKVGIGLPTFMLREDFQVFILAIFFVTLLVIVPGAFLLYYYRINQYGQDGLKKETLHVLGGTMSAKIGAHRIISLIAASKEIRDLGYTAHPHEMELLSKICQGKEMDKIGTLSPEILKACLLIYTHLSRQTHGLPLELQQQTRQILRIAMTVSRAMLNIAFINNWTPAIQIILAIRKCLLQGVEIGSVPVTQIPHILLPRAIPAAPVAQGQASAPNPQEVARIKQLLEIAAKYKPTELHDLIKVSLENRNEALQSLTDEEVEDIRAAFKVIPKIKFEGKVFVDDEDEICMGDVATFRGTFTREHLQADQKQGDVHSPYYPDNRQEEWFAFIADHETNELHGYKTFTDNSREVTVDIMFPITKPGNWKLTAVVLSDTYFGVDKNIEVSFKALHPSESQRTEFVHPDDVALDNQASFVQQMLGTTALYEEEGEVEEERAGSGEEVAEGEQDESS